MTVPQTRPAAGYALPLLQVFLVMFIRRMVYTSHDSFGLNFAVIAAAPSKTQPTIPHRGGYGS